MLSNTAKLGEWRIFENAEAVAEHAAEWLCLLASGQESHVVRLGCEAFVFAGCMAHAVAHRRASETGITGTAPARRKTSRALEAHQIAALMSAFGGKADIFNTVALMKTPPLAVRRVFLARQSEFGSHAR